MEIPTYSGKMNAKEFVDWRDVLNNYFEYKEVVEEKKVKFAKTKLKGAYLTWWNYTQGERVKMGESMIHSWDRIVSKLKAQLVHVDYEVKLYRRMQNLKQKDLDVA